MRTHTPTRTQRPRRSRYTNARGEIDGPAEDFRSYLEAREPDEVVGRAASCTGCPIAGFLAQRHGLSVAVETHLVLVDGRELLTERWMDVFMEFVDRRGENAEIAARDALADLDRTLQDDRVVARA